MSASPDIRINFKVIKLKWHEMEGEKKRQASSPPSLLKSQNQHFKEKWMDKNLFIGLLFL